MGAVRSSFKLRMIGNIHVVSLLAVLGSSLAAPTADPQNPWSRALRNGNRYNSPDKTGYMEIEDESCRLKTICELEAYAVSHPLASRAIETIDSSLRGLERYQT